MSLRSVNQPRRCARTSCRWPASATLTYSYRDRIVWIEDLRPQREPNTYDLCAAHAERTSVPVGWKKQDGRIAPPAPTVLRPDRRLVVPDADGDPMRDVDTA